MSGGSKGGRGARGYATEHGGETSHPHTARNHPTVLHRTGGFTWRLPLVFAACWPELQSWAVQGVAITWSSGQGRLQSAPKGCSEREVSWCHGVNARSHLPQEAVARGPGRARVAQYRSTCDTLCDAPRPPPPFPALPAPMPHGMGRYGADAVDVVEERKGWWGGGGVAGTQTLAYQKWPSKLVPTVHFLSSHDGHFGLGGGVQGGGGGLAPLLLRCTAILIPPCPPPPLKSNKLQHSETPQAHSSTDKPPPATDGQQASVDHAMTSVRRNGCGFTATAVRSPHRCQSKPSSAPQKGGETPSANGPHRFSRVLVRCCCP